MRPPATRTLCWFVLVGNSQCPVERKINCHLNITSKKFDTFGSLRQSQNLGGEASRNRMTNRSISMQHTARRGLYTPEERIRRDATVWTLVQGVLAPLQFVVCIVSLVFVVRYLRTGEGQVAADISVLVKTFTLYTIMVTGSIWEKVVFGKWLFAAPFWWEDAVSMVVIALHTIYLVMLIFALGTVEQRMFLALTAYATYAINATQFILKLRTARLDAARVDVPNLTGAAA